MGSFHPLFAPLLNLFYQSHKLEFKKHTKIKQARKKPPQNTEKQPQPPAQILLFFLCCECTADDLPASAQSGEMQR